MKLGTILLPALLASSGLFAADPFLGKWVWNEQKSPKPIIRYAIKDLGNNRYSLTGSTGETTNIKADGVLIKSPFGGTVSFKKVDDHDWQMIRNNPEKMVRIYSMSPDDKTLTLTSTTTYADGKQDKNVVTYARSGAGHSIVGEWQSVSVKDELSGGTRDLEIEQYGKDGLSFISPSERDRLDIYFDGKLYAAKGAGAPENVKTSGKRVSANLIEMETQLNGKPSERVEYRLSDDGKTLTVTDRAVNSTAVFKDVFDRR